MLPLKPQYNMLHFINKLLLPNICTFWDADPFLHSYPIFSILSNLNYLTWRTQKFKYPKTLPGNYPQPKLYQRSLKDPKLILISTCVHILLVDDACRCFVSVATISVAFWWSCVEWHESAQMWKTTNLRTAPGVHWGQDRWLRSRMIDSSQEQKY